MNGSMARRAVAGLLAAAVAAALTLLSPSSAWAAGAYTPITALDGSQGGGWTGATGPGATAFISPRTDAHAPNGSLSLSTTGFSSASVYRTGNGFGSTTKLAAGNVLAYDSRTSTPVAAMGDAPELSIALNCGIAVIGDEITARYHPEHNTTPGYNYDVWTTWNAADPAAQWRVDQYISTTPGGGVSSLGGPGYVGGTDAFTYATLTTTFNAACPDGSIYFMSVGQYGGLSPHTSWVDGLTFSFDGATATPLNAQYLDFRVAGDVTLTQSGTWGTVAPGATTPPISFTVSSPTDGPYVENPQLNLDVVDLAALGVTGCQVTVGSTTTAMTLIPYSSGDFNALSGPLVPALAPGSSFVAVVQCGIASTAPVGHYLVTPSVLAAVSDPIVVRAEVATSDTDTLTIAATPVTTAPTTTAPTTTAAPTTSAALAATGPSGVGPATLTGLLAVLAGAVLLVGAMARGSRGLRC